MSINAIGGGYTSLNSPNEPASTEMGKEEFLKLLTTQLSNQDPLSPMKNEEFVAQLATFSSLEQQIGTNERLDAIAMGQMSQNSSSAVSFIGKSVRAMSDWVQYDGAGAADLSYELLGASEEVSLVVTDSSGKTIRTVTLGAQEAGAQSYTWDGMDNDGNPMEEGDYSLSVSAKDSNGDSVKSWPVSVGRITGISYENGYPELLIGDRRLTLGDVIEVLEGG